MVIDNNRINSFLRTFIDNVQEFRNLLIKNKAVISGSIVLQMLLNETYDKSDIDIYIPYILYKDFYDFLESERYELLYSRGDGEDIEEKYNIQFPNHIARVDTFKNNYDGIIQICRTYSPDPRECLKSFDFTFLLNYFDGNDIFSMFPAHVFNKCGIVNNIKTITSKRFIKYNNRGFTIIVKPLNTTYQHKYFNKITDDKQEDIEMSSIGSLMNEKMHLNNANFKIMEIIYEDTIKPLPYKKHRLDE